MRDNSFFFRRERLVFTSGLVSACSLLCVYVNCLLGVWTPVFKGHSLVSERLGSPLAGDFIEHWTASYLVLKGDQATIYDAAKFKEIETYLLSLGGHTWSYPPTALLIDWPLALMPYILSLAAWLAITMGLYLFILYRIAPCRLTILWGLAFFGTFENFYYGQNGFLSAAFLGGGLLLLDGSPFVGGVLLGLLSYKPHLAALVPLALLAGSERRALAGFLASSVGLLLTSMVVLGTGVWRLFLANSSHALFDNLYANSGWLLSMPTMFGAARTAGFGVQASWILHGLFMLLAVALLVWVWLAPALRSTRVAALSVATLFFSPQIWFYDLPILMIALAWIGGEAHRNGWRPREQFLLLCGWIAPFVSFSLAHKFGWQTGSLYLLPVLILIVRRVRNP